MTNKPIQRHYAYGHTFRWIQGESQIVVKTGYVIEGQAFIVRPNRDGRVQDRPHEVPGNDHDTWVGTIAVPNTHWNDKTVLPRKAAEWAHQHGKGASHGV